MTPADVPLPQSLLASPACPLPADLGEPELVIPSFVSAHDATATSPPLFPGSTVTDDELAAAKALLDPSQAAAYTVVASTPFFPSPAPHYVSDVDGAHVVLACMPYAPTPDCTASIVPNWATTQPSPPGLALLAVASPPPPPAFPVTITEAVQVVHSVAMEPPEAIPVAASLPNAIATLRSSLHHTPPDRPGTLSQTSAPLQREAVELIANQEAFESLVHQHKMAFMKDPNYRACIQWAVVRWMLDQLTKHDPLIFPGGGQTWKAVLLALIQRCLNCITIMEEETLQAAAEAWEFFLVVDSDSLFQCKRARSEAPTGSKHTRSGSRAPTPVLPSPQFPLPPFQTIASEWKDGVVVVSSSEDMSDSTTPQGHSPASSAPTPALQDIALLTQLPLDTLPLPVLPPLLPL